MANSPENYERCLHKGKCEYFSIRNYVFNNRKTNPRENWPFPFDYLSETSKNDILSEFPPMELPKLKCWKCYSCLPETNSPQGPEEGRGSVEKINVVVSPMENCSNHIFACNAEGKRIEAADTPTIGRMNNASPLNQRKNEKIRRSRASRTENRSGEQIKLQNPLVSERKESEERGTTLALEDSSTRKSKLQTKGRQSSKNKECKTRKKARRNTEVTETLALVGAHEEQMELNIEEKSEFDSNEMMVDTELLKLKDAEIQAVSGIQKSAASNLMN